VCPDVAHAPSAVLMRWYMQNGQDGKTALELAYDEGTIKCFFDSGIKLSGLVTDEVMILCFCVRWACMCMGESNRKSRSIWYAGVRGRTRVSEETRGCCWDICIRAIMCVM